MSTAKPLSVVERLQRLGTTTPTPRQHRAYLRAVERERRQLLGELPEPKADPRRATERTPADAMRAKVDVKCEPGKCPLGHKRPKVHRITVGAAINAALVELELTRTEDAALAAELGMSAYAEHLEQTSQPPKS